VRIRLRWTGLDGGVPDPEPIARPTIQVRISPWTDPGFVRAAESCVAEARAAEADGLRLDSPAGAAYAERVLRASGFPRARVLEHRDLRSALRHVARWDVIRDGEGPPATS